MFDKDTEDLKQFAESCNHNPRYKSLNGKLTNTIVQDLNYDRDDGLVDTELLISRDGNQFYYLAKCLPLSSQSERVIDCLNTHFMKENMKKHVIKFAYDDQSKYICIVCYSDVSTDLEDNRGNYLGIRAAIQSKLDEYEYILDKLEDCRNRVGTDNSDG